MACLDEHIHLHKDYAGLHDLASSRILYAEDARKPYLFILCIRDVLLHAERPVDVERVLVQGEHEDDEDEERVEHRKEEDHLVAQLFEAGGDGVLLRLVGVQRVEVLLDQVRPEGDFRPGEVVHLAAREHRPVLNGNKMNCKILPDKLQDTHHIL